jgi:hypothetical protein
MSCPAGQRITHHIANIEYRQYRISPISNIANIEYRQYRISPIFNMPNMVVMRWPKAAAHPTSGILFEPFLIPIAQRLGGFGNAGAGIGILRLPRCFS